MKKNSRKARVLLLVSTMIATVFTASFISLSIIPVGRVKAHEESMTAPFAKVNSTIDGKMSTGEWDDAQVEVVGDTNWYGYIYYKRSNKYLYLLLDHVSDTDRHPSGWDNGWCGIDINSDKGSAPKEDDLLFHEMGHCWIGDGPYKIEDPSQWAVLIGQTEPLPQNQKDLYDMILPTFKYGAGWGKTEASSTDHVFCEFGIPLAILGDKTTCGIWIAMQDNAHEPEYPTGHILEWPEPGAEETKTNPAWWPGPDFPQQTNIPPDHWGTVILDTESLNTKPTLPTPPQGQAQTTPMTLEGMWIYIVAGVGIAVLVVIGVTTLLRRRKKDTTK